MSAFLGPIHIYAEQAKKLAEKAKIRDDVNKFNLDDAFEIINEHFVERMPCDRLSGAIKSENKIIWKHQNSLHQEFWKETKVKLKLMHQLYTKWLSTFAKVLNPLLEHERKRENDHYNDIFFIKR
ncbi:MAG: hypothetical protein ACQER0_03320 [Bacillota bacterium]